MHRVLYMCQDAAVAALILIPVFLLLNRFYFRNAKKAAMYFLMAVYLSGMFAVVGLPDIRYVRFDPHFNLKPFAYMFSDFTNSFLNVLLFLPLGFFLPVFWKRFRSVAQTLLFGFCTSLLVEFLQIFTFRASDINDLMTNTLGTLAGWLIGRLLLRLFPGIKPGWRKNEVFVVCSAAFCVMFFLHPFLEEWIGMQF